MEGRWYGVQAALAILVGLAALGCGYEIIEGPRNATVLAGSQARFNCSVSPGWKLLMWALKGVVVLSLTPTQTIITNDRFTNASYEVGDAFVSEMIIHDVRPSDAGRVRCSLQSSDRYAEAFLSVQVMGTLRIPQGSPVVKDEPCNVTCLASGWTPLPNISWEIGVPVSHSSYYSTPEPDDPHSAVSILTLTPQDSGSLTCVARMEALAAHQAVSVNLTVVPPPLEGAGASLPTWAIALLAVSLSLLLILVIVLVVIFCCCCVSGREKKDSSYDIEIRKSADVKPSETVDSKPKGGSENYGYWPDELRPPATTGPVPSTSPAPRAPEQRGSRQPRQRPDDHQRSAPRPQVTFHVASPKKVRNITIV